MHAAARRWTGYWIWTADEGRASNAWRHFRGVFDAAEDGDALRLLITAESHYRVWLNGKMVGEGPPPSTPDHTYVDEHEVRARAGRNVLAVLVHHLGASAGQTRGGLLAELVDADGRVVCATGPHWRAEEALEHAVDTPFFHANKVRPFAHVLDTRFEGEPDWRLLEHDDTSWPTATAIGGHGPVFGPDPRPGAALPWTRLVARDIPFPRHRTAYPRGATTVEECAALAVRFVPHGTAPTLSQVGVPVETTIVDGVDDLASGGALTLRCSRRRDGEDIATIREPCLTIDFGRVITARPSVTVDGPAGVRIDLGYAERLVDGRFNNAIEAPFADSFITAGGRQSLRTHQWQAFRYLRLRVHDAYEPIVLSDLHAEIVEYPFEERGAFRSGDPELDAVFEISRRTLQLCSIESIMDTPWRESAQWVGDVAAVTLAGIYSCFGDTALAAKFLRQAAAGQLPRGLLPNISDAVAAPDKAPFADYSLWWLLALADHHAYTGDTAIVRELYPVAVRVLQYFARHVDDDGLVADLADPLFIDWAHVDRRGANAVVNAMLAGALQAASRLADLIGDAGTAAWARHLHAGIRGSFRRRLYDEREQCVVDAEIDGGRSPSISEHGNAAALLWDLLDEPSAAGVIDRLWAEGTGAAVQAEPFFTSVVLRALARHRRHDLALGIVRERWGRRMVSRGATSTWEQWSTDGDARDGAFTGFMRSLSHAWSAYPAQLLVQDLLGIQVTESGCRRVSVDPAPHMPDAEVTWPTPLGPLHATRRAGTTTLRAPRGMVVDAPSDVVVLTADGDPTTRQPAADTAGGTAPSGSSAIASTPSR